MEPKKTNYKGEELTEEQVNICFFKSQEIPGSGKYNKNFEEGVYKCIICGTDLFESDTKFDSNTGWPAFFQPIDDESIEYKEDHSHGLDRIEVNCGNCGSHLGHVFDDGPKPTGQRYCVNSLSLDFVPSEDK